MNFISIIVNWRTFEQNICLKIFEFLLFLNFLLGWTRQSTLNVSQTWHTLSQTKNENQMSKLRFLKTELMILTETWSLNLKIKLQSLQAQFSYQNQEIMIDQSSNSCLWITQQSYLRKWRKILQIGNSSCKASVLTLRKSCFCHIIKI